ncbi:MAG TPA: site-specific DNA-methyltransferase [Phycisphaerales bacterium]|nr:site-specific DNA-methyltransferase [Phycisphaerales bacterium]
MNRLIHADSLAALPTLPAACAALVYMDPPFNTGATQKRRRMTGTASDDGNRSAGFHGRRYKVKPLPSPTYGDNFEDYLDFLMPRIEASVRCMTPTGSLFVHLDFREVHYVKVELDRMLGRDRFMNEIIWAYDYGGRPKTRWPCKHDTILWYAMDPSSYTFNFNAMDRLPYMAPKLVTPEKRERGKTPTDVWWQTIVPTNSREKTGYPTQKPLAILERIIKVHTNPGDTVLDPFAGSGTTGEAAARHGRGFILIDESTEALTVMRRRLGAHLEEAAPRLQALAAGVPR